MPTGRGACVAKPEQERSVAEVRQHYRVQLELLTLRCRSLESWFEDEAAAVIAQERAAQRTVLALEEQTINLSVAMAEQQRAFRERLEAMQQNQDVLICDHRQVLERKSFAWSVRCDEIQAEASAAVAALQKEFRRREEVWLRATPGQHDSRLQLHAASDWTASDDSSILSLKVDVAPSASSQAYVSNPTVAPSSDREQHGGPQQFANSWTCGPSDLGRLETPASPQFGKASDDAELDDLVEGLRTADMPQAARLWARIGQLHQRRRAFGEAHRAYTAAVRLDGEQHGCLANLAQLEAHAGDLQAAQEFIARAHALDPSNEAYASFARWLGLQ